MAPKTAQKTAAAPTATDSRPLFYQNPTMLDTVKHRDYGVTTKDNNYAFASSVNAVPVTLIELPQIMMNYPIVFTAGSVPFPAVLLGLRDGQNLFVDANGQWAPTMYIPAYIRRYPFILADQGNAETFTLCIDDVPDWFRAHGGERLFNDDGSMASLTQNALEFCQSYHAASTETMRFAQALQQADILIDRNATIQREGEAPFQLSGFRQVDEEKLRNLPATTVTEWHRQGWLAMLYAHLLSAQNWQKLFDRLQGTERLQ